jgi:hypothetical protein
MISTAAQARIVASMAFKRVTFILRRRSLGPRQGAQARLATLVMPALGVLSRVVRQKRDIKLAMAAAKDILDRADVTLEPTASLTQSFATPWHDPPPNEHQVAIGVGAKTCPGVRGSGLVAELTAPFAERGIGRILRNRIPAPLQSAGPCVDAAHFAACGSRSTVVADRRPSDHDAVDDDRRGCHGIAGRL